MLNHPHDAADALWNKARVRIDGIENAIGERLVEADILKLNDGQFADFVFSWHYDMFGDGSKLRRSGFTQMQATDEMFFSLFAQLRAERIIP